MEESSEIEVVEMRGEIGSCEHGIDIVLGKGVAGGNGQARPNYAVGFEGWKEKC